MPSPNTPIDLTNRLRGIIAAILLPVIVLLWLAVVMVSVGVVGRVFWWMVAAVKGGA